MKVIGWVEIPNGKLTPNKPRTFFMKKIIKSEVSRGDEGHEVVIKNLF